MVQTDGPSTQMRLRGPPDRLRLTTSVMSGTEQCRIVMPALLRGGSTTLVAHVVRRPGGIGQLRACLPQGTPPGDYAAQLDIDGQIHPITLSVEPHEWLSAQPAETVFEGSPGKPSEVEVTLFNRGNVAISIPSNFVVGLYDNDGLEEAFASTYRQQTEDAQKLLGHWITKMREGSGGLLKCRVAEGGGDLPPGAERVLKIRANLPTKLKPKHFYHGVWELGRLIHSVGVDVRKGERGGQR